MLSRVADNLYWMRRYVDVGASGVLHDAPRPGRKKRITPEHVARIVKATLRNGLFR